ncbi:phage antirepressor N-terminal domain-containing protein [Yersinia mollaretii]|uniref:phage antirepressor N-terminal domain-containing protein n=1 Tax=Yersinia TaxID=629 RepID=UPI00061C710C|nr:phage antirepressor N-terminal domain-containing protein [Yersinia mollaretii]CNJ43668.1 phage antirepressor [Yersinia mollaretii]
MPSIATQITTINVTFHGQSLTTIFHDGQPFVAMRPIVENIGIDWSGQMAKLKNQRDKFGCRDISTPSKGGVQQMLCLPLRKLNGWLFSINPEKVRADIRDKLIQYQEECFSVLHEYWTKGLVVNPRKATKKALPGKITLEQQEAVKQLVMNRGKALPKENQAKAIITMWSALKTHFGCSYKDISEDQFTDALSLAARVPIEGEFLGKQEALPAPKLEVSLPIQWWLDNNPAVKYGNRENIAKMKQNHICFTPSLNVTIDMLCGDSDTSAAIQLINIMEMAGYDVSAPKAEIVAMRKHIANVEYGMKAISDACIRAKNKKVIFRGKKAEITIN